MDYNWKPQKKQQGEICSKKCFEINNCHNIKGSKRVIYHFMDHQQHTTNKDITVQKWQKKRPKVIYFALEILHRLSYVLSKIVKILGSSPVAVHLAIIKNDHFWPAVKQSCNNLVIICRVDYFFRYTTVDYSIFCHIPAHGKT